MAKKRGADKGTRVRDAVTGRFQRGTQKRRPGGAVVARLKSRGGRKK
jgi:hypothetical protein